MFKFFRKLFKRRGNDDDDFDPKIEGDFEDDRSWLEKTTQRVKKSKLASLFNSKRPKGKGGFSLDLSRLTAHANWIRWGLVVIALFLLSEVVARYIGILVRPKIPQFRRSAPVASKKEPKENYSGISQRNMFNVEGNIPEPFDQGMLDCFSQAQKSSKSIVLLGTIVMKNENYSVALIQGQGKDESIAVKKDDKFLNKYTALKVERQRLCFQVDSTQDLEYIEVKDDTPSMALSQPITPSSGSGITPTSEDQFQIKKSFLDDKLGNLNEILQSARAVPYIDGSGAFKGFLIQSIQQDSIFYDLGVRQGDVLNGVNDIKLDNAGKGLEAFQRLRNSQKITLEITRGGSSKTLSYEVQ